MEHLEISKRSARMLLAAWDSADSRLIRNAVEQADAAAPVSTWEAERIEMIREAGCVLRGWTEGARAAVDVDTSLLLLRHFASCGDQGIASI